MLVFWEEPRGERGIYGENRNKFVLLRVVVECPYVDILILRLFLGDFRWG